MSKRLLQIAVAFIAVAMFVLAPIACQQAEKPAETTDEAETAGSPSGKKLMAHKPKAEQAAETAEEMVEEGAEALEEGAEAVEETAEEAAEDMEDMTEGH